MKNCLFGVQQKKRNDAVVVLLTEELIREMDDVFDIEDLEIHFVI
jgi:hypothetical protein